MEIKNKQIETADILKLLELQTREFQDLCLEIDNLIQKNEGMENGCK